MEASLALADLLYKVGSADAASQLLLGGNAELVGLPFFQLPLKVFPASADAVRVQLQLACHACRAAV